MKEQPRYLVDYEAIAQTANPLDVIEQLVDRTARPGFDRDRLCARCEGWTTKDSPEERPVRPYAENPLQGCAGCVLSHLDENPAHPAVQRKEAGAQPRPCWRRRDVRVQFYERGRPVEEPGRAG